MGLIFKGFQHGSSSFVKGAGGILSDRLRPSLFINVFGSKALVIGDEFIITIIEERTHDPDLRKVRSFAHPFGILADFIFPTVI